MHLIHLKAEGPGSQDKLLSEVPVQWVKCRTPVLRIFYVADRGGSFSVPEVGEHRTSTSS